MQINLGRLPVKPLALIAPFLLGAVLASPSLAQSGNAIEQAVSGEHREDKNKARDKYRNPKQTLEFFGLEPGMTVVEIAPGGGWYTEVLAPVVKDEGKLIAVHYDTNAGAYQRRSLGNFLVKMGSNEVYENVHVVTMAEPADIGTAGNGQADMVLTFRNVHNWMRGDAQAMFNAMYAALKPGGVLGVVEHRAPKNLEDPKAEKGYVTEDQVMAFAEEAGFEFVEKSDVNANPKDTADHPRGVWTLPPSLALGDQDRDKYKAIGESDRMTMKFRKPAM